MKDLIERTASGLAEILVPTPQGLVHAGSGFALTSDGKLATCVHVIDGLSEYRVKFWGQTEYHKPKLLIQDAAHDLAVLSVQCSLRPLPLGEFSQVELGDELVWAGFPLAAWVPSFHKGMISYKGELPLPRTASGTEGLQLDGTINRGVSGGPIVDPRDGRVIAVVSSSMGSLDEGLGSVLRHQGPPGVTVKASIGGIDPIGSIKQIIANMERYLQLGVGYGISVDHLSSLVARL